MLDDAQLNALIATLDAKRAELGDKAVDQAIAVLRQRADAKGAPAPASADTVRLRQVSIVFCDIVDSTATLQSLDAEDALRVIGDALRRFGSLIEGAGGRVLRYTGDGVKAAFGTEHTREDDALRAVETGLALLQAARDHAGQLQRTLGIARFAVRVGIDTGDIVLGGGAETAGSAMGHAVHVAARLEQAAPPGCLLIGERTLALVRGHFEVQRQTPLMAKGVSALLENYLVLRARPYGFQKAGRGIEGVVTRMIGRDAELHALQEAFTQVAMPGSGVRRVLVTADAGVGKSRLLREFEHWAEAGGQPYRLLRARATPQTPGQPYGLLRELLGSYLGILDGDAMADAKRKLEDGLMPLLTDQGEQAESQVHRLGQLIGLDYGASPHLKGLDARQLRDGGFGAAMQALRHVAAPEVPLMLLLDDLHWADAESLEFLERLVQAHADVPLLTMALARPTLFDRKGTEGWIDGPMRLNLKPLEAADSASLADELLQRLSESPTTLRTLITARAEGNPFYMEELVKMLIDQGAIVTAGERWHVNPDKLQSLRVPPTLTGVLQARLDSLPGTERHVLQLASVIGVHFWDAALAHVEHQADGQLASLERRELVHGHEAASPPAEGMREYAFRHQILHQVTYDTVLKAVKRHAHARTAEWLAQQALARSKSFLGSAAEHYERAGDPLHAAEFYAQAADHMQRTFANDAAIDYATRGLRLVSDDNPQAVSLRWRLLSARERVCELLGRREEQRVDVEALQALVEAMPEDDIRRAEADWRRGDLAGRRSDWATMEREMRRALALSDRVGDERMSLRALQRLAIALSRLGRVSEAEALGKAALDRARSFGDPEIQAMMLSAMSIVVEQKGDRPANLQYNLEYMELSRQMGHRRNLVVGLHNLGVGYLMLGVLDLARRYLAELLRQVRELGATPAEGEALLLMGLLAWREGALEESVGHSQAAIEILRAVQSRSALGLAETNLGQAELELQHLAAAQAGFEHGEAIARELGDRSCVTEALIGQAETALARGDQSEAQRLAERVLAEADAAHGAGSGEGGNRFAGMQEHMIRLGLYRIWSAAGDPRAEPMLAEAHEMLTAEADSIGDATLRESFLTNLAENREILALWARERRSH